MFVARLSGMMRGWFALVKESGAALNRTTVGDFRRTNAIERPKSRPESSFKSMLHRGTVKSA